MRARLASLLAYFCLVLLAAFANMVRAGGLDIVSVARDRIVSIVGKPDNPNAAAPPDGKGPNKPPKDDEPQSGDTCDEIVPVGVTRIAGMSINNCVVSDAGYGPDPDYSVLGTSTAPAPAVCVVDTGVYFDHKDLNVDRNYEFTAFTREGVDDLSGHGTHVAGTIGARANTIGVVGVAPNARIISIKVLNRRGSGSYRTVLDGLESIAKQSADGDPICAVANMSLGGPDDGSVMADAVRCLSGDVLTEEASAPDECTGNDAIPLGITFTLAAGNSYTDASDYIPANTGFENDNIHTIAAMDSLDEWAWWSNFGDPVDYILPGVDIDSTFKNDGYKTYSVTSMAAPHMAGLVLRNKVNGTEFGIEEDLVTRTGTEDDNYFIAFDDRI
ncbi:MAG: S8 family serine peptidase [Paracoccaceae bacterium]